MSRVTEKTFFLLIQMRNEVADQMRGTCNCAADQRRCLHYRDNTSVSDSEDRFFSQHGSYSIIIIRAHQEGLSACSQCEGMGKLGWVKAIHRLKCNHVGCFYFQLYEYYAFAPGCKFASGCKLSKFAPGCKLCT